MNRERVSHRSIIILLVTVSTIFSIRVSKANTQREAHDFTVPADAPYEPGELLVRFAPKPDGRHRSITEKNQILSSLGGGIIKQNFKIVPGLTLVELPAGLTVKDALKTFNNIDGILHAQPNYILKALSTFPDDSMFNKCWGMHNIGQPHPKDYGGTSSGTQDADIDAPQA